MGSWGSGILAGWAKRDAAYMCTEASMLPEIADAQEVWEDAGVAAVGVDGLRCAPVGDVTN